MNCVFSKENMRFSCNENMYKKVIQELCKELVETKRKLMLCQRKRCNCKTLPSCFQQKIKC